VVIAEKLVLMVTALSTYALLSVRRSYVVVLMATALHTLRYMVCVVRMVTYKYIEG
jgi:hypothetical protein